MTEKAFRVMPLTTQKTTPRLTPGQVFARFREQPEMQAFIRDCYYDAVQAAAARFADSAEFAEVLAYARAQGKGAPGMVLDVGGGNGMASLAWEQAGYRAILLEPDADPIVGFGAIMPLIAQGKTGVRVCAAFGESIPFPDATFDIVYIRQVLHHIHDLDALAVEIRRVLKPGGLYIATREHVVDNAQDLATFLAGHIIHQQTGGEGAYSAAAYEGAMRKAGFREVQVLRRWQSIINYYPATADQVRDRVAAALSQRTGWQVAKRLVRVPWVYRWLLNRYAARDTEPGRMYSFLAVK